MPTLRLTHGDLRKALPHGQRLTGEVFCGVSPVSGAMCGTEVRVLVIRSHCGEEDLGPGFGEAGPYCLVPQPPSVSLSIEWGQVGHPYRVCGSKTEGQAGGWTSREGRRGSRLFLFSKSVKVRKKQAPREGQRQVMASTLPPGRGPLLSPGCWVWDGRTTAWIWVLAQPPVGGMTLSMTIHLCVPQPSHP